MLTTSIQATARDDKSGADRSAVGLVVMTAHWSLGKQPLCLIQNTIDPTLWAGLNALLGVAQVLCGE